MNRTQRRWLFGLVAIVTLAVYVVVQMLRGPGESRALERMPAESRVRLYEQTYAATRTLCDEARKDDALRGRCASWAELLLEFPECDDGCRAFATPWVSAKAVR